MATMDVYIDGEFHPPERATVSVFNTGFLYGDGVFEGLRIDRGAIFRLREHVERLYRSAHYLRIPIALTREELAEAVKATARRAGLRDGYLRIVLSRGQGGLGTEAIRHITRSTLVIIPQVRSKFDDEVRLRQGITGKIVSVRRTPPECVDPRIKSCNYLNQILARFEQWDAGAGLGILLSTDGHVSEGCAENIFCVSGGRLRTPPAARVLDGITRQTVMALARSAGLDVAEVDLTAYDLFTADEVFACGTLTELVPLTRIDGRQIGAGVAGPVTLRLLAALRKSMAEEAEPAFP